MSPFIYDRIFHTFNRLFHRMWSIFTSKKLNKPGNFKFVPEFYKGFHTGCGKLLHFFNRNSQVIPTACEGVQRGVRTDSGEEFIVALSGNHSAVVAAERPGRHIEAQPPL